MMGLSTVPAPAAISEALTLVNAMLDPAKAKAMLEELAQQVDALNKARDAAVAEQQKAAADRVAADARINEAETRVGAIAEREKAVTAREVQAERVRALTRERLAGMEA
jgi:hypothetical protein